MVSSLDNYINLMKVDDSKRDVLWEEEFFKILPLIELAFSRDQNKFVFSANHLCILVYGPDRYQGLDSNEQEDLEVVTFAELVDFALENKAGIAFNPNQDFKTDWIFRCGDLECYKFLGIPYKTISIFEKSHGDESEEDNLDDSSELKSEYLTGEIIICPLNEYLSQRTIENVYDIIYNYGINSPEAAISLTDDLGIESPSLITNIFAEDFEDRELINAFMKDMSWILPSHMSFMLYPNRIQSLCEILSNLRPKIVDSVH